MIDPYTPKTIRAYGLNIQGGTLYVSDEGECYVNCRLEGVVIKAHPDASDVFEDCLLVDCRGVEERLLRRSKITSTS
ncbi:hypothetical protein [Nitratireductor basaltis]|uniref:Uncharacterized protein n=1 Tax=Nitratireductor basaltis TaxID=472175 RepID=A0A084UDK9_9HYPH|nr:hypothetical protein [Nitratireductor basaltis]KFB11045.1 hypothetical protein EL18_02087 [Nitratireductor basaltis]